MAGIEKYLKEKSVLDAVEQTARRDMVGALDVLGKAVYYTEPPCAAPAARNENLPRPPGDFAISINDHILALAPVTKRIDKLKTLTALSRGVTRATNNNCGEFAEHILDIAPDTVSLNPRATLTALGNLLEATSDTKHRARCIEQIQDIAALTACQSAVLDVAPLLKSTLINASREAPSMMADSLIAELTALTDKTPGKKMSVISSETRQNSMACDNTARRLLESYIGTASSVRR